MQNKPRHPMCDVKKYHTSSAGQKILLILYHKTGTNGITVIKKQYQVYTGHAAHRKVTP